MGEGGKRGSRGSSGKVGQGKERESGAGMKMEIGVWEGAPAVLEEECREGGQEYGGSRGNDEYYWL